MTPEIITRSFSNDQLIFDKVFFTNCYNLKGKTDGEKIVVDIGAHCGYFAFLALTLGARKVYCFEPFIDNYKLLLNNCYNSHFSGRVIPYQVGVYTDSIVGKFTAPKLIDGIYFDFSGIEITGDKDISHYPINCLKLDDILVNNCFGEQIDILKINIGYAEIDILQNSNVIAEKVVSICGETKADEQEFFEFKKKMVIKGFFNCHSSPPSPEGKISFIFSQIPISENYNIS